MKMATVPVELEIKLAKNVDSGLKCWNSKSEKETSRQNTCMQKFSFFLPMMMFRCTFTYASRKRLYCEKIQRKRKSNEVNEVLSCSMNDKFVSYCSQPTVLHPPALPLTLCMLCHAPVTADSLQCPRPRCGAGLHRDCVQERADSGDKSCPSCQDVNQFSEEMSIFGIWFRNKFA